MLKSFRKGAIRMPTLHDETRYRWMLLTPEKFIGTVLYGVLREKVKLAYTAISVYTQIVHSLPGTGNLQLKGAKEPIRLRELLKQMRTSMADAHDIIQCDTQTLTVSTYTPSGYILSTVRDLRYRVQPVEQWAALMAADAGMAVELPTLDGKRACDVAAEIQKYTGDVIALLDFAQSYAEGLAQQTA